VKRFALLVLLFFVILVARLDAGQNVPAPANAAATSAGEQPATPLNAEGRADLFMVQKDYSAALAAYKDVLRNNPKNATLLNKAGIACQQLGNVNDAERFYRQAFRADKKFGSAMNNIGTLDYQRSRYGKAIKSYKKAIEIYPASASIYSNLGYAYYANKQYPEAMQAFGKALTLDATIFEHKGGTGSLLQQRSAPDPGLFYFLLAKSFAKTGDAERAAHYLKLSRDDGYKDFALAAKDPEFATVIKDPRVQEVLRVQPSYGQDPQKADVKGVP
jgi:tetratricopeptide (TPR) repeat protein